LDELLGGGGLEEAIPYARPDLGAYPYVVHASVAHGPLRLGRELNLRHAGAYGLEGSLYAYGGYIGRAPEILELLLVLYDHQVVYRWRYVPDVLGGQDLPQGLEFRQGHEAVFDAYDGAAVRARLPQGLPDSILVSDLAMGTPELEAPFLYDGNIAARMPIVPYAVGIGRVIYHDGLPVPGDYEARAKRGRGDLGADEIVEAFVAVQDGYIEAPFAHEGL
jgi:hypothetical protein